MVINFFTFTYYRTLELLWRFKTEASIEDVETRIESID